MPENIGFRTLLVVDDNADDIEILRIVLESIGAGIQLLVAVDGDTAMGMLHEGLCRPDLVLLDLKLPGMSGIDVLRQIRAEERFKRLPVIISSSSILESDMSEAIAAGASGYIGKTFNIEVFREELAAALNRWCDWPADADESPPGTEKSNPG